MSKATPAFAPKSLPFSEWPSRHRSAWEKGFNNNNLFNDGPSASHWRDQSVTKTRKGYGVWLYFLTTIGVLIEDTEPAEPLIPSNVARYIDMLKITNSGYTPYDRICALCEAIRIIAPDHYKSWLKNARSNLRKEARASRAKNIDGVSSQELEKLGVSLMERVEKDLTTSDLRKNELIDWRSAEAYRDGLMIALLARRSLRNKNISQLKIGDDILIYENSAVIFIEARKAKAHKTIELPFPKTLFQRLINYLSTYQPALMARNKNQDDLPIHALWVNRNGHGMSRDSFRKIIAKHTQSKFGKHITPHWFRDISATTIISQDPASTPLAAKLLGHSGPEQIEKHYDHTSPNLGARRYFKTLSSLRRSRKDY